MSYIVDRKDIFDALGIEADSKIVSKALKSFSGNIEAIKQVMDSLKGQEITLNQLTDALKKVNEENVKFKMEQQRIAAEAKKTEKELETATKAAEKEKLKAAKQAEQEKIKAAKAAAAEKAKILKEELAAERKAAAEKAKESKANAAIEAKLARDLANEKQKALKQQQAEEKRIEAERLKALKLQSSMQLKETKMASDRKKLLIQAMQAEKGSIEQLTAVNKVLQLQMAKLNVTIPEQAAKYGKLQQAVVANRNAMMQYAQAQMGVVAGSGRVRREFNGIQFQVTQLARELPALAYGPHMFIAAISNNFPMLQEEIKKVRIQNELLKASGQATVPVWKNIAKAIISWQTAIILIITAYMMWHKQIHAYLGTLFNHNKQVDRAAESQNKLKSAMKESDRIAADEAMTFRLLTDAAKNTNLEMDKRLLAVDELKSLYPEYLKHMSDEKILAGDIALEYAAITREILASAKARAIKAEIDKNAEASWGLERDAKKIYEEILELEKERAELNKKRGVPNWASSAKEIDETINRINELNEKINNLRADWNKKYADKRAIDKETEWLIKQIDITSTLKKKENKNKKAADEFDNRIQMRKLNNEEELIKFQMAQRDAWLAYVEKITKDETLLESEKKDKIEEFETEQAIVLFNARRVLSEKLTKLTEEISAERIAKAKGDKKKILQIEMETAEQLKELENEQLDYNRQVMDTASEEQIKNIERDAKIQEEKAKIIAELREKISDETIDYYFDEADAAILAAQDTTLAIIKDRKLRNREIEKLQRELALQEVRSNILAVRTMLDDKFADGTYKLTDKARADKENQLNDLMKRLKELQIENSKKGLEDDVEKWKEWADAVSQIVNEFFNLLNSLYENQLQVAKNLYESESKYAGVSVEQKLEAEKKLERREKAVKKKQAIAQKAQTIFNIVMNLLAHKSKGALGLPEMIVAGAAMATAIATPLPAFEDGGKHKKAGMAKVSEKGQEIFIDKKTGKMFLTPKNETIAHFPAGEFIPHDETQKMLANFAMTNNKEIIDMSKTNDYLSSIDRNTRNQTTVNIAGGYKIIVRNGITSKIRL